MRNTDHPGSPSPDYSRQRVAYSGDALLESDLAATPLQQFELWYAQARDAGEPEPNAMVIATVDGTGQPSARTVLLKQADSRGLVFFTNYTSRKAIELAAGSGRSAVVFCWLTQHRQVSVRGIARRVDRAESEDYFRQRPWGSRIGAWASRQSRPAPGRSVLEDRWAALVQRWPDRGRPDDVPVPDHWGGYVIEVAEMEFWQGRPSRLHDRLAFLTAGGDPAPLDDGPSWRVERREP